MSPKPSALVGSPRYGGMEPLNALFDGRRNIAQKPSAENIIVSPPAHKVLIEIKKIFAKILNRILQEEEQCFHIEHSLVRFSKIVLKKKEQ